MNSTSREIRRLNIKSLFNRRGLWRCYRCCLSCFLLFGQRTSACTFDHLFVLLPSLCLEVCLSFVICLNISLPFIQRVVQYCQIESIGKWVITIRSIRSICQMENSSIRLEKSTFPLDCCISFARLRNISS